MATFTVNMTGLSDVLRKIEAYSKDLADSIDTELSVAAQAVALTAKVRAPKGKTGALSASIYSDVSVRFSKRIIAPLYYSPYVEFGTGARVFENKIGFEFSPEIRAFAREFYVNGMGRMPAQPYLFPAYEVEKKKFIQRVKDILFKTTRI